MSSVEYLDQAIVHLEEAVRQARSTPRYGALLGVALLLRGEPDAALPHLKESFQAASAPRTAYFLGLTLMALDRFQDAMVYGSEALQGSESFTSAHEVHAWAAFALGHWEPAATSFRSLLEAVPGDARSALGLAAIIGFRHLDGDAEAEPARMRACLDVQNSSVIDTREGRFLRQLAEGRRAGDAPETHAGFRLRLVHGATRGILKDLPQKVHASIFHQLSVREEEVAAAGEREP